MKNFLVYLMIWTGMGAMHSLAGTLYVDNSKGNDNNNGRQMLSNDGGPGGPVASLERASEWKKVKFGGSLNSELAETVKLMGSDRSEKPVGARLPPAVWERYFQLVKENVTPCGVIKND
ncbi:MAG: hypothetical protein PHV34_23645 [Verrucomicrobiae bacterium]|nr:hypothetical protein [Verrucomicrobiae bacterium]